MSSSNRTLDANGFIFFVDLLLASLQRMESGVSVTRYAGRLPQSGLDIEFEVQITKLDGYPVPRVTDAAVSRIRKGKR